MSSLSHLLEMYSSKTNEILENSNDSDEDIELQKIMNEFDSPSEVSSFNEPQTNLFNKPLNGSLEKCLTKYQQFLASSLNSLNSTETEEENKNVNFFDADSNLNHVVDAINLKDKLLLSTQIEKNISNASLSNDQNGNFCKNSQFFIENNNNFEAKTNCQDIFLKEIKNDDENDNLKNLEEKINIELEKINFNDGDAKNNKLEIKNKEFSHELDKVNFEKDSKFKIVYVSKSMGFNNKNNEIMKPCENISKNSNDMKMNSRIKSFDFEKKKLTNDSEKLVHQIDYQDSLDKKSVLIDEKLEKQNSLDIENKVSTKHSSVQTSCTDLILQNRKLDFELLTSENSKPNDLIKNINISIKNLKNVFEKPSDTLENVDRLEPIYSTFVENKENKKTDEKNNLNDNSTSSSLLNNNKQQISNKKNELLEDYKRKIEKDEFTFQKCLSELNKCSGKISKNNEIVNKKKRTKSPFVIREHNEHFILSETGSKNTINSNDLEKEEPKLTFDSQEDSSKNVQLAITHVENKETKVPETKSVPIFYSDEVKHLEKFMNQLNEKENKQECNNQLNNLIDSLKIFANCKQKIVVNDVKKNILQSYNFENIISLIGTENSMELNFKNLNKKINKFCKKSENKLEKKLKNENEPLERLLVPSLENFENEKKKSAIIKKSSKKIKIIKRLKKRKNDKNIKESGKVTKKIKQVQDKDLETAVQNKMTQINDSKLICNVTEKEVTNSGVDLSKIDNIKPKINQEMLNAKNIKKNENWLKEFHPSILVPLNSEYLKGKIVKNKILMDREEIANQNKTTLIKKLQDGKFFEKVQEKNNGEIHIVKFSELRDLQENINELNNKLKLDSSLIIPRSLTKYLRMKKTLNKNQAVETTVVSQEQLKKEKKFKHQNVSKEINCINFENEKICSKINKTKNNKFNNYAEQNIIFYKRAEQLKKSDENFQNQKTVKNFVKIAGNEASFLRQNNKKKDIRKEKDLLSLNQRTKAGKLIKDANEKVVATQKPEDLFRREKKIKQKSPHNIQQQQIKMYPFEKVYVGIENISSNFNLRGKIIGAHGANLNFIRNETGAIVTLRGKETYINEPNDSNQEPLHLYIEHTKIEGLIAAKQLAVNLVETIQQEVAQFQPNCIISPPSNVFQQIPNSNINMLPSPRGNVPLATNNDQTMVVKQMQIPENNVQNIAPQNNMIISNTGQLMSGSNFVSNQLPQSAQNISQQFTINEGDNAQLQQIPITNQQFVNFNNMPSGTQMQLVQTPNGQVQILPSQNIATIQSQNQQFVQHSLPINSGQNQIQQINTFQVAPNVSNQPMTLQLPGTLQQVVTNNGQIQQIPVQNQQLIVAQQTQPYSFQNTPNQQFLTSNGQHLGVYPQQGVVVFQTNQGQNIQVMPNQILSNNSELIQQNSPQIQSNTQNTAGQISTGQMAALHQNNQLNLQTGTNQILMQQNPQLSAQQNQLALQQNCQLPIHQNSNMTNIASNNIQPTTPQIISNSQQLLQTQNNETSNYTNSTQCVVPQSIENSDQQIVAAASNQFVSNNLAQNSIPQNVFLEQHKHVSQQNNINTQSGQFQGEQDTQSISQNNLLNNANSQQMFANNQQFQQQITANTIQIHNQFIQPSDNINQMQNSQFNGQFNNVSCMIPNNSTQLLNQQLLNNGIQHQLLNSGQGQLFQNGQIISNNGGQLISNNQLLSASGQILPMGSVQQIIPFNSQQFISSNGVLQPNNQSLVPAQINKINNQVVNANIQNFSNQTIPQNPGLMSNPQINQMVPNNQQITSVGQSQILNQQMLINSALSNNQILPNSGSSTTQQIIVQGNNTNAIQNNLIQGQMINSSQNILPGNANGNQQIMSVQNQQFVNIPGIQTNNQQVLNENQSFNQQITEQPIPSSFNEQLQENVTHINPNFSNQNNTNEEINKQNQQLLLNQYHQSNINQSYQQTNIQQQINLPETNQTLFSYQNQENQNIQIDQNHQQSQMQQLSKNNHEKEKLINQKIINQQKNMNQMIKTTLPHLNQKQNIQQKSIQHQTILQHNIQQQQNIQQQMLIPQQEQMIQSNIPIQHMHSNVSLNIQSQRNIQMMSHENIQQTNAQQLHSNIAQSDLTHGNVSIQNQQTSTIHENKHIYSQTQGTPASFHQTNFTQQSKMSPKVVTNLSQENITQFHLEQKQMLANLETNKFASQVNPRALEIMPSGGMVPQSNPYQRQQEQKNNFKNNFNRIASPQNVQQNYNCQQRGTYHQITNKPQESPSKPTNLSSASYNQMGSNYPYASQRTLSQENINQNSQSPSQRCSTPQNISELSKNIYMQNNLTNVQQNGYQRCNTPQNTLQRSVTPQNSYYQTNSPNRSGTPLQTHPQNTSRSVTPQRSATPQQRSVTPQNVYQRSVTPQNSTQGNCVAQNFLQTNDGLMNKSISAQEIHHQFDSNEKSFQTKPQTTSFQQKSSDSQQTACQLSSTFQTINNSNSVTTNSLTYVNSIVKPEDVKMISSEENKKRKLSDMDSDFTIDSNMTKLSKPLDDVKNAELSSNNLDQNKKDTLHTSFQTFVPSISSGNNTSSSSIIAELKSFRPQHSHALSNNNSDKTDTVCSNAQTKIPITSPNSNMKISTYSNKTKESPEKKLATQTNLDNSKFVDQMNSQVERTKTYSKSVINSDNCLTSDKNQNIFR